MRDLQVISNKSVTIDSREVSEMLGVNHWEILRKLEGSKDRKGYIKVLTDNQMVVSDYFIKSSYKDETGKENKCYLFTKMGCEFIANKFTGEKGILFTAKYVKRFNEMEEHIKENAPSSIEDIMICTLQGMKEVKQQLNQVNNHALEAKEGVRELREESPLFGIEMEELQKSVRCKGIEVLGGYHTNAYDDKSLRTKVYSDIQRELKRQFGVNSYKAIKRKELQISLEIISKYKPPFILQGEIECINSQIALDEVACTK